jgi:hypothetical protein
MGKDGKKKKKKKSWLDFENGTIFPVVYPLCTAKRGRSDMVRRGSELIFKANSFCDSLAKGIPIRIITASQ